LWGVLTKNALNKLAHAHSLASAPSEFPADFYGGRG
jgi:hypothetical protein